MPLAHVNSQNVEYNNINDEKGYIHSKIEYHTSKVTQLEKTIEIFPEIIHFEFKTNSYVPKTGLMMVGLAGNNATTLIGTILANQHKITWSHKNGLQFPNFYGSVCLCSTMSVGFDSNDKSKEIFIPLNEMIPMINPCDIVFGGWDINNMNIGDAMKRAKVFEYELQKKLYPLMNNIIPLPSIYKPSFIALNQSDRANNILNGSLKEQIEIIRNNIRDFKKKNNLQKIIVLWTANTERYCIEQLGIHDNAENLLKALNDQNDEEISPSICFAIASILENCSFINGSPQNTLINGVIELAQKHGTFLGGDDFKTGQTKLKSVLVDFLIGSGIKPRSIVSYNHLGNNDGYNLSAPCQFKSKEISKSGVVEDMVESNKILYKDQEKPDHCIVIKYVPYVGDSKRAMDEYISEISMGGQNSLIIHNTCEDSLLASTVMLDLIILTELFERVSFKINHPKNNVESCDIFNKFNSVLSFLSFLLKAPKVPKNAPIVNSLFKQRNAIENLLRALVGMQPNGQLQLEHR